MAEFRITVDMSYDDRLQTTADYVFERIEQKINKVLQEYSKEHFSKSFVISPAVIKEIKKKEK